MLWTLALLGLVHGLQPDHLAAAAVLSARSGSSAWRAAIRIAGGHGLGLFVIALLSRALPVGFDLSSLQLERVGGGALFGVGVVVVLQALRGAYLVHAHTHEHGEKEHAHVHAHVVAAETHSHSHAAGPVLLGALMALSGARAAVLLSLLPSSVTLIGAGLTVHAVGIGVGAAGGALLIDLARRAFPSASHRRWIDGVTGLGACVCGGALLVA